MIYTNTWNLAGKRGSLTIREQIEWVSIGRDGNGDGQDDTVATGAWKVVRGTGAYARIAGGGGNGHAGLEVGWIGATRASSPFPSRPSEMPTTPSDVSGRREALS